MKGVDALHLSRLTELTRLFGRRRVEELTGEIRNEMRRLVQDEMAGIDGAPPRGEHLGGGLDFGRLEGRVKAPHTTYSGGWFGATTAA